MVCFLPGLAGASAVQVVKEGKKEERDHATILCQANVEKNASVKPRTMLPVILNLVQVRFLTKVIFGCNIKQLITDAGTHRIFSSVAPFK